jgi:predicted metal-binding membrane protein
LSTSTLLEEVLRRDRFVILAALAVIIAIAWAWIALGAGTGMNPLEMSHLRPQQMQAEGSAMSSMAGMSGMMMPAAWTPAYAGLMLAMWWVMMVAMMLPGAAPMLLLFARINRKEKLRGQPYVPTGLFAAGYLAVWGFFSVLAVALQWEFDRLGILSPELATTDIWLAGSILIAAGVWQLTPVKSICLRHCRAPFSFLIHHWRPGRLGAFRMGITHGAYCLGCCWFLMALLFFGGVMNLYWVAGLAVFILLEKTIPFGNWFARAAGLVLSGWGIALLASAA